jgi:hypothetical protein
MSLCRLVPARRLIASANLAGATGGFGTLACSLAWTASGDPAEQGSSRAGAGDGGVGHEVLLEREGQ